MKKNILFLFIALLPFISFAQTATIKGVIKDEAGVVVPNVVVKVLGTDIQTTTDSTGSYTLNNVPFGPQEIQVGDGVNISASEKVDIKEEQVVMNITSHATGAETISAGASLDIPTLSLSDDDLKEGSSGNVSSILTASRDPFNSASSFVFSIARFRIRGYDSDNFPTLMNGAILTNLANNRSEYNVWSGLNDVVRTRDQSIGLTPTDYAFGEVGGMNSIDSRASQQRKQLQVSYASSNRAYDNRVVITYGSGVGLKGWSYSLSYSRRWSDEGYVPGTFYDGNSFFGSLEKKLNSKHSLALTLFAAKTKNGRTSPVIQELYDLAGTHYYNKNWGWQNGKKRNASVGDNFQPVAILTHDWAINPTSSLLTAFSFSTGKNKYSGIDWYRAKDPRPDYYRNLPSFDPSYGADPQQAYEDSLQLATLLINNPDLLQIDWASIYEANQLRDTALYVLTNFVTEADRYCFNTVYNNLLTENIILTGGLSYQLQELNYYKEIDDMLGGKYYLNLNQFADETELTGPDVIQNDLNNPNRRVYKGDKYGYDYIAHIYKSAVWGQSEFKYEKFDFFVAAQLTLSGFHRTGNMRNGVFKDDSYGDSEKFSFTDPAFKGGITYKVDGRNYIYANGGYLSRAPLFENTFVSPRTRNTTVDNPESEHITSVEGGYIYRAPRLRARATGYLTQFSDIIDTKSFYYEDLQTFVNYTISGISKKHTGIELAIEAQLGYGLTATAVAAVGEFVYDKRPIAKVTQDNLDTLLLDNVEVLAKNLRVAAGPHNAYTFGLNYRSKNFWFLSVNANFFENIYIDYNPVRRTIPSLEYVEAGSPAMEKILSQEKRDGEFTLDASAGWSWKFDDKFKSLKKNAYLVFNVGLSNILDNKDIIVTGYEQLRFDSRDGNPDVYPSRYAYAYGRTYFASVTLRFN